MLPLLLSAGLTGQVPPPPEAASARTEKRLATARRHMVAAAHPEAAKAGLEILEAGGSAVDAAVATQLALGVVEPQSSGIGGGTILLSWDARTREADVADGRETAPMAAAPERFLDAEGRPLPTETAIASGLAVGVPGSLRALEMAHARHGKLPWRRLVQPALRLCERGFRITPRLHRLLEVDAHLRDDPGARAHFYGPDGHALPVGRRLRNPELAAVLRQVASRGPRAFYEGPVARDMVRAVRGHARPGDLCEADLKGYRAVRRVPIAGAYRGFRLVTAPPEAGGATVLELLGILEAFDLKALAPGSPEAVHRFAEAGRLAFADREAYAGDPLFVRVPTHALLDPAYLKARAALIRPDASLGRAEAGRPLPESAWPAGATPELPSTTHVSIVDRWGNAVAMTSTVEAAFGSRIYVRGFLLNNQMTDFSFVPEEGGRPVANRVQPGKRPRSAMSPTLVFDAEGRLRFVVGSPGGSSIVNYVAQALVNLLDWGMDPQAAVDALHYGSRNGATELEEGPGAAALKAALERLGHSVAVGEYTSGLHVVEVREGRLYGGADPRREGVAVGR